MCLLNDGSYDTGNCGEEYCIGPVIAIPAGGSATLTFNARNDDEFGDSPDGFDRVSVWVTLKLNGAFDGSSVPVASSHPSVGGADIPENVGYNLITVDLTAFAGQSIQLIFSFTTFDCSDDAHPGARIDDLLITSTGVVTPPDAGSGGGYFGGEGARNWSPTVKKNQYGKLPKRP